MTDSPAPPTSEVLLYRTEDGRVRVECRFEGETLWLTQAQMAELFQVTVPTINEHLKGIYEEAELLPERTIRSYRMVRAEGKREVAREIAHYALDTVLAVGYRVRSPRGTAFRQWATERLREYVVKGFALDDVRLKQGGGGLYFDELLARIRDIRASEKMFWRKVLDIYATSIDYDPSVEASQRFFATVQNKMHWAAHGHTAAEVVYARADAGKPNMGLTGIGGSRLTRQDASIAKNYLTETELDGLNRIVTAYLDFAELQAMRRSTMTMAGWIAKLDDFLRLSEHDILTHAGRISHEAALKKAEGEFERFQRQQAALPSRIERDFEAAIKAFPTASGKRRSPKRPDEA
ncbi:virulence RhuM family protein [Dokdonella ginsengisoli]|uniref:Virulence RhuM family protein n=1 Tax=Dokdonella ginsengisoli TaxID=363846 RepID=A0ABV9QS99_9GAMM